MAPDVSREPLKYADLFEREAWQHIGALRSVLDAWRTATAGTEQGELLSRLRNESHGLTGVGSAVGLEGIAQLMRAVERASVAVLRGGTVPSTALMEAMREAVDSAEMLGRAALEGRGLPSVDVERLVGVIDSAAGS